MYVYDIPEHLPFISQRESSDIDKDAIYVRRGTKCEKATAQDIDAMIESKVASIYKDTSDLSLDEHLRQLRRLYEELPQNIKVLIRKGEPSPIIQALTRMGKAFSEYGSTPDEYEEMPNPDYPDENYEAFIHRLINAKKLKIEKVLDLK